MIPPINLDSKRKSSTIKFLYSYGGWIKPRFSDGSLRYIGGFIRVVTVDRSISFADLMVKFVELCGISMNLKCKLPKEDLDLLVTIKSDEDLQSIIGEYDREAPAGVYIRAVLLPIIASLKYISPSSFPLLRTADYTPVKHQLSKISGLNLHQPPPCMKYLVYPPSQLHNRAGGTRNDELRDAYRRRHGNPRLYPAPYPFVTD